MDLPATGRQAPRLESPRLQHRPRRSRHRSQRRASPRTTRPIPPPRPHLTPEDVMERTYQERPLPLRPQLAHQAKLRALLRPRLCRRPLRTRPAQRLPNPPVLWHLQQQSPRHAQTDRYKPLHNSEFILQTSTFNIKSPLSLEPSPPMAPRRLAPPKSKFLSAQLSK